MILKLNYNNFYKQFTKTREYCFMECRWIFLGYLLLLSISCHPHVSDMKADLNIEISTQKANADYIIITMLQHLLLSKWLSLSLRGSHKAPGSCLHLHPLEGVAFSSSPICQDVPCPPVDTISHSTVSSTVISAIQVSCQTGIKPPACTIILATVPSCVTVVVPVSSAEGSAIMIVTFAVAQCITCIARIFPGCETIPGGNMWHICQMCCDSFCPFKPMKMLFSSHNFTLKNLEEQTITAMTLCQNYLYIVLYRYLLLTS